MGLSVGYGSDSTGVLYDQCEMEKSQALRRILALARRHKDVASTICRDLLLQ
jgi:hypothetical protein